MQANVAHSGWEIFVELVDCAYHAAFDESEWPAFLEHFADALHGRNTALVAQELPSKQNHAITCVRTDPEQLRLYNEHYCNLNPWLVKGSADLAAGRVGVGEMHCDTDALLRTEFYNGWLQPQGLRHSIAAVIVCSSKQVVLCSTLRSASVGPFASKDIQLYESLLPHLRRALRTRERARGVFDGGRYALEVLVVMKRPAHDRSYAGYA